MTVVTLIRAGEMQPMRPWPRYLLTPEAWRAMVHGLASGPEPAFLGLWADTAQVHALFMADAPLVASVRVESGLFDALSPARPAAALFERMAHDLWGHLAGDGVDPRPLLDQGRWPVLRPLSARPVPNSGHLDPPEFLGAVGHDLHQLPIGPIGVAMEAVHLRITADGESVVRLEAGMGYAHRGVLALMHGKPLHEAAALASRIAAGSTVAHAIAFARAAEAAAEVEPPPLGQALRAVMSELERIASHLSDLGMMAPNRMAARCGELREGVLRASHATFGHRLMMDCAVPGGVASALALADMAALSAILDHVAAAVPGLRRGLNGMKRQAAGIGRSGQDAAYGSAARRLPGYLPYDRTSAAKPGLGADDVLARLHWRLADIQDSVALLRRVLARLPSGPPNVAIPAISGEGLGLADGPRGDVWHWLRLDAGIVTTNFACDPAWLHWPLIEAACCGARLSDVPAILRSFNPAIAGLEL